MAWERKSWDSLVQYSHRPRWSSLGKLCIVKLRVTWRSAILVAQRLNQFHLQPAPTCMTEGKAGGLEAEHRLLAPEQELKPFTHKASISISV